MDKIKKAYAITDAKISFVSLVDKAATQKQFLIAKAENKDERGFASFGKIIKSDSEQHHITGIVYAPLEEDAHDNYMTADEIQKAAYWFAKNGDKVDLQHNFEECDACTVVETWVAKADFSIDDEPIKKGTWLMTVEVNDDDIWYKIEKKEITGFSMGGVGKYSTEDVDVNAIEKGANAKMEEKEKKGIFKQFAEFMGFSVVEKGAISDGYAEKQKHSSFWNAFDTLQTLLSDGHWDNMSDRYVYDFENDEEKIKIALEEFSTIIIDVLAEKSIAKSLSEAAQASKKMSSKKQQNLTEEEETEVKKEEIQKMIDESIKKELNPTTTTEEMTEETIHKMIEMTVSKAMQKPLEEKTDKNNTENNLEKMISEAVSKAIEPVMKFRGLPSNLNAEINTIEKNEQHYLADIL